MGRGGKNNIQLQSNQFQLEAKTLLRDNYKCVNCSQPTTTVAYLIDLRLWSDQQGKQLNNCVSLCDQCSCLAKKPYSVLRI